MKYYLINFEPTEEQVSAIEGESMSTQLMGVDAEGKYIVGYDETKYPVPEWLENEEEMNFPGCTSACPHCGGEI